eukprot:gene4331-6132_t
MKFKPTSAQGDKCLAILFDSAILAALPMIEWKNSNEVTPEPGTETTNLGFPTRMNTSIKCSRGKSGTGADVQFRDFSKFIGGAAYIYFSVMINFIILTAPNEKIAVVYRQQIESMKASISWLDTTKVACIADPEGIRIGSGGGTINALDYLLNTVGMVARDVNVQYRRVIIIHSGGDSRRAPLYSLSGKAWTTLNSKLNDSVVIVNPLLLLMKEINSFCKSLPHYSLIVASSDVLLDITQGENTSTEFENNAVSVIAVQEDGVLVGSNVISIANKEPISIPASNYLQKPSLIDMRQKNAVYYPDMGNIKISNDDEIHETDFAMVDTGVVIFTGTAFEAMLDLVSNEYVNKCTKRIIQSNNLLITKNQSEEILRLELYSDILLATAFSDHTKNNAKDNIISYYERLGINPNNSGKLYMEAINELWKSFRNIPLHLIYVPTGIFEHLGTSSEVLTLLTYPFNQTTTSNINYNTNELNNNRKNYKLNRFANKYQLNTIIDSQIPSIVESTEPFIYVNSSIISTQAGKDVTIKPHNSVALPSVIEHCLLKSDIIIGNNSMCSHIGGYLGNNLQDISSNIIIQQIYLQNQLNEMNEYKYLSFVLMILHIKDDVKTYYKNSNSTINGVYWSDFFQLLNINPNDIWPENIIESEKSIWNANLFSICYYENNSNTLLSLNRNDQLIPTNILQLTWLQYLTQWVDNMKYPDSNINNSNNSNFQEFMNNNSFNLWLLSKRISLADILAIGDARKMFHWRNLMQVVNYNNYNSIDSVHDIAILFETVHLTCSNILKIFQKFISLSTNSISQDNLMDSDICILSKTQLDRLKIPKLEISIENIIILKNLNNNTSIDNDINSKGKLVIGYIIDMIVYYGVQTSGYEGSNSIMNSFLSQIIESYAQQLITIHLQSSLSEKLIKHNSLVSEVHHTHVNKNRVVVVKAPVRIDLAGGWSDTPPICYESSGAVLNMAVLVDNLYPIRCTARFISDPKIVLHSLRINAESNLKTEYLDDQLVIETVEECNDVSDVTAKACLLKAVLIVLNIVSNNQAETNLKESLRMKYGGGIEIACVSDLPAGSGMGGSSILAAAVLRCVGQLLNMKNCITNDSLIDLVSQVEQLMTTGGGWQDQIGSIYGGFKIARSDVGLPLNVTVEMIPTSLEFNHYLESRMYLIYTGQQRLAKRTLINALRKYSVSPPSVIPANLSSASSMEITNDFPSIQSTIVGSLIHGAEQGKRILMRNDDIYEDIQTKTNLLAQIINDYWFLKKKMAPGSEPLHISKILDILRPISEGVTLCGAGAGGYAAIILKAGYTYEDLTVIISDYNNCQNFERNESNILSIHKIKIEEQGLFTSFFENIDNNIELVDFIHIVDYK